MREYHKRVAVELEELRVKLAELREFLNATQEFLELPYSEKLRLEAQERIMSLYEAILIERMLAF